MYKEFDEKISKSVVNTLAVDWDETTGDYPLAFRELSKRFDRVIVVTVNDELVLEDVCKHFDRTPETLDIYCFPFDRYTYEDIGPWKASVCEREKVALMFDDDPNVIRNCHKIGVNAILVSERSWKFD